MLNQVGCVILLLLYLSIFQANPQTKDNNLDKSSLGSDHDVTYRIHHGPGSSKPARKYHHVHDYYRNLSSSFRTLSWMNYYEVDGLINQDIVMIITSTATSDGKYLRQRVIQSARTWVRLLKNVFVVMEDSVESRFYFRNCQMIDYSSFTTFKCPHEPYYILTRNCTNEYYAANGICCKVDESIQYLMTVKSKLVSHMKYLIFADDDTYWRVDQLMSWLSFIDKRIDPNVPIVGNGVQSMLGKQRLLPRNKGVFHIDGCKEIFTNGWYQPVLLNRRAFDMIAASTASYSIRSVCREFDISQDLGFGIFFWLFQFYHVYIPGIYTNPNQKGYAALKADLMAIHAVRGIHEDFCNGEHWPSHLRYNQHMMTGCGKPDTATPQHDIHLSLSMYDAWNWFAANGSNVLIGSNDEDKEIFEWIIEANGSVKPVLVHLSGYNTTRHSQQHNITDKWVPFTRQDCAIPGVIMN
jgi:hypothetical protein